MADSSDGEISRSRPSRAECGSGSFPTAGSSYPELRGVLRELAPGASLDRDDLRLVLVSHSQPPGLSALHHSGSGGSAVAGGRNRSGSRREDRLPARWPIRPRSSRIFVEADGELLGTLPAAISIVPDALTLLVPRGLKSRVGCNLGPCSACLLDLQVLMNLRSRDRANNTATIPFGTHHSLSDRRLPGPCRVQPEDGAGYGHDDAGGGSSRHRHPGKFQRSGLRLCPPSRVHPFVSRSAAGAGGGGRTDLRHLAPARAQS